jgi:hypothetical protein
MARKPWKPVKERDVPVPCLTCGRPTWSLESHCVHCRWFGPPEGAPGDPLQLAGPLRHEVAWETLPLPSGTLSPAGVVLADATCRVCSYNLRGLLAAGLCPECACPVIRSLSARSLATADLDWLRNLERGAVLILAGLVMLLPGLFVFLAANAAGPPMSPWAGVACEVLLLLAPALGLILLTTAEPDRQDEPARSARQLARGALLAAFGVTLYLPLSPVTQGPLVYQIVVSIGLVLYAVGVTCLLLHIRGLFLLARWRRWAGLSLVSAIGLAVALGLTSLESIALIFVTRISPTASFIGLSACCSWILTIPFGICGIVALVGLCRCLSKAQQQSHRYRTTAEFEQQAEEKVSDTVSREKVRTDRFYPG